MERGGEPPHDDKGECHVLDGQLRTGSNLNEFAKQLEES